MAYMSGTTGRDGQWTAGLSKAEGDDQRLAQAVTAEELGESIRER
jgi:hypothetical protein